MPSAALSAGVLLLVLVLVQVQDAAGSPLRTTCSLNYQPAPRNGWIRMNNKQLKLFKEKKNFQLAENHCVHLKGHLVSIHNQAEHYYVTCLLIKTNKRTPTSGDWFWIGARSAQPRSGYGWTDGSPYSSTDSFIKWDSGKPVDKWGHQCVLMNVNKWGQWANVRCDQLRMYVCVK